MQVFFAAGAKRVSLKSEGLTLLYFKNPGLYYARKYFIPPKTEHNTLMGSIFKLLSTIWKSASPEFKEQFALYAEQYNMQYRFGKSPLNGYACFTKLMFEFRKQHPDIDLAKLTWQETLFGVFNRDTQDEQDEEKMINLFQIPLFDFFKTQYSFNIDSFSPNLRKSVSLRWINDSTKGSQLLILNEGKRRLKRLLLENSVEESCLGRTAGAQ